MSICSICSGARCAPAARSLRVRERRAVVSAHAFAFAQCARAAWFHCRCRTEHTNRTTLPLASTSSGLDRDRDVAPLGPTIVRAVGFVFLIGDNRRR